MNGVRHTFLGIYKIQTWWLGVSFGTVTDGARKVGTCFFNMNFTTLTAVLAKLKLVVETVDGHFLLIGCLPMSLSWAWHIFTQTCFQTISNDITCSVLCSKAWYSRPIKPISLLIGCLKYSSRSHAYKWSLKIILDYCQHFGILRSNFGILRLQLPWNTLETHINLPWNTLGNFFETS